MAGRAQRLLGIITLATTLVMVGGSTLATELHSTPLPSISTASEEAIMSGYDSLTDGLVRVSSAKPGNSFLFDVAALRALGTIKVRADYPKGRREHVYEGPLLKDVLDAAGARGKTVTVYLLDGFRTRIPLKDLVSRGAVLAYKRDGRMFNVGDFGPAQIVFPRAERDDLSDMSDDFWLWSVFYIAVE